MEVITIGHSNKNNIVIPDSLVSRHHLQIILEDNGNYRLADFGSANGTFVNGNKISGEVSLNPTDVVKIGNTTLPWKVYFFQLRQDMMPQQPLPMVEPSHVKARIKIKTGFFLLAFLFLFCSPVVEFNGQKNRFSWGTRSFDLPEGEYHVSTYVPYLFWRRCGENSVKVKAKAGGVTKISFRAPLIVFAKGSIKIL
jgi:hypothetical protein